jgi:hypothetical protein
MIVACISQKPPSIQLRNSATLACIRHSQRAAKSISPLLTDEDEPLFAKSHILIRHCDDFTAIASNWRRRLITAVSQHSQLNNGPGRTLNALRQPGNHA